MEAEQSVEPTGTNRSNPLDPQSSTKPNAWPNNLGQNGKPPACSGKRHTATGPDDDTSPGTFTNSPRAQIPHGHKFPTGTTNSPHGTNPPQILPGTRTPRGAINRGPGQPGGHSEGPNTRSHPELGRENPQRRWYCVSRRGRAGRRQALPAPTPSPPRPSPHPNPTPRITRLIPGALSGGRDTTSHRRGVEQPGSSSGS